MTTHEPSEQTLRSIDRHREAFARVKGTTRNAVDQLLVGNVRDPYVPFREFFLLQAIAKCEVHNYIDDLRGIVQAATNGSNGFNVIESITEKLHADADMTQTLLEVYEDGVMSVAEARQILNLISRIEGLHSKVSRQCYKVLGMPEAVNGKPVSYETRNAVREVLHGNKKEAA